MLGSPISLGFTAVNSSVEQIWITQDDYNLRRLTEHELHSLQVPDKLPYLKLALDVQNLTEQGS